MNVKLERKGHIAVVTINRPEALNCFNYDTLHEFGLLIENISTNREIRTVIITGKGKKAFSTGADLKERKNLTQDEVKRNVKKIREVFDAVAGLPQPTIAAVNGYAFGGGFELMLACDFKIAAREAMMGLTEVSLGIIPGAGGTQRLPRLVGETKAKELIFTARKISADQALQLGILSYVVHQVELMDKCIELAEEIMKNAPIAVRQAKAAINMGLNTDLQTGILIEAKAYEVTVPTKDRVEALKAFSEKRNPMFLGE